MEYVMLVAVLLLAVFLDFIPRLKKKNKAELTAYCILFAVAMGFFVCFAADIYWVSPSRLIREAVIAISGQ